MNGYSYSNNSPVTYSDPSGLRTDCGSSSRDGAACPKNDQNGNGLPDNGKQTGNSPAPVTTSTDTSYCDQDCQRMRDAYKCGVLGCQATHNLGEWCQHNEVLCYALSKSEGFNRTIQKIWDTEKEILGISDFESCRNGDLLACAELQASVVFQSKLRVLAAALREGNKYTGGTLGCLTRENSFSQSTLVLMKDGKLKPIKDIKPGDEVEAADPKTGKHIGTRRVTARLVHHDDDLTDVTVQASTGETKTLHTTSRHPFWDDTSHTWVEAGQLTPGHVLNTADNKHTRILSVAGRPGAAAMYNLTIEQLHTYYVLAGTTSVLAHNDGGTIICQLGQQDEKASGITKNTQKLIINGRTRIPDELDPAAGVIGEVKNVKYQHLSKQIKDDLSYASANGYQFNLYIRSTTRISRPLQDLVNSGDINLIRNLP
ncbi:putative toxin [Streptomyces sp. NPDC008139]|uniref:putative toxin n=1 Tax=Streptomyces sp. NPDC008139 TaxID=3364814 RepID=UPI0036E33370